MSVQIAALIVAILNWKKYKNSSERYFLFFLIYVVFNEVVGSFIGSKNLYIYNIFTILTISFYLFWFYQILKNKRLIKGLSLVFLLTIGYSIIKERFWTDLWTIPFIPNSIIIIICATLFFNNFLNSEKAINYTGSQQFWIVTGILIFYIGFLPMALTWDMIDRNALPFRLVLTILNLILYGSFIKSFLCLKEN